MNWPTIRKPNISRRTLLLVLAATAVGVAMLIIVGILYAHYWYAHNLRPKAPGSAATAIVTIDTGENAAIIGDNLQYQGLIRSSRAFSWYVTRANVRDSLQAGTYKFSPSQSVQQIVEKLNKGEVDTTHITLLPAKRLDQLKAAFSRSGFSQEEIDAALQPDQYRAHPSLKDLPAGQSLEGYLYPETFAIDSTSTLKQVVDRSISELDKKLDADLLAKLSAKKFNLHQAFTLASIIEKETSTLKDRPLVAQVFEKRLASDMSLGSDVTFMYAAAVTGQPSSPNLDSPYNTRKVKGLPPGPISNFSLSSLQAVAEPADTDYLYFVAGDDGTVHYTHTEQEHNQAVEKYCTKLCH